MLVCTHTHIVRNKSIQFTHTHTHTHTHGVHFVVTTTVVHGASSLPYAQKQSTDVLRTKANLPPNITTTQRCRMSVLSMELRPVHVTQPRAVTSSFAVKVPRASNDSADAVTTTSGLSCDSAFECRIAMSPVNASRSSSSRPKPVETPATHPR